MVGGARKSQPNTRKHLQRFYHSLHPTANCQFPFHLAEGSVSCFCGGSAVNFVDSGYRTGLNLPHQQEYRPGQHTDNPKQKKQRPMGLEFHINSYTLQNIFFLHLCLRLDAEYSPKVWSSGCCFWEVVESLGDGAWKEALRSLRLCPVRGQGILFCSLAMW